MYVYMYTYIHTVKCQAKGCPLGKEVLIKKEEIVPKIAGVLSYRNAADRRALSLY